MKRKVQIQKNNLVRYFLSEIGFGDKKALQLAAILKQYNIYNVAQFVGAFSPSIPRLSQRDLKKRGIVCSARTLMVYKKPVQIVAQLQRILKISRKEAVLIFNASHNISGENQSYYFNFKWSLGGQKRLTKKDEDLFWESAPNITIAPGFFVIPKYDTAGNIFDQGERGTCVANAFCTLLGYKSEKQTSRQFLYHQCKMIDGIPEEEGTFMDMPFRVLDSSFSGDYGCISENVWPYNPSLTNSQHQGPPPEKSFNSNRIRMEGKVIEPRQKNLINDIIYSLNYGSGEKTCPVPVGLELYPSFFSKSTTETGWVTMPLPGEPVMGYHAMIIVGYDEDRKLFLVRNSWGTAWAAEHDKGFKGHAWIPYKYVEKYGFDAQTVESVKTEQVVVPPEDRLYNNMRSAAPGKIAATRMKKKTGHYPSHRIGFMGWLIRAAVIILLWNAYHEPIKKITIKTLEIVQSKIDVNAISDKAKNFIEENLTSNN